MHHLVLFTDEEYQDLNPVQFGFEKCSPTHVVGPAVQTYWVIHFVLSGHGVFQIGKNKYTPGENDIFIIPPYVETYYQADETDPWTYIWIGFTAGDNISMNLPNFQHCPELRIIFQTMKSYERNKNTGRIFLCAKLWEIYAHLQQTTERNDDYINTALSYIHSQYMNPITVELIANYLNLERTYFSALFKKHTGVAPKQYLLNFRMKTAAQLLARNNSNISVVAASVGYTDIYNFSRMFKKCFGVSPNVYRKNHFSKA